MSVLWFCSSMFSLYNMYEIGLSWAVPSGFFYSDFRVCACMHLFVCVTCHDQKVSGENSGFGLKATSSFSPVTQKHTRTHTVLFTSSWLFFTLQTRAIHHREKKERKMEKSQSAENIGAWERSRNRKMGEKRGKDTKSFLITSAAQ